MNVSITIPYIYLIQKEISNGPRYKITYPFSYKQLLYYARKKFGKAYQITAIFDENGIKIDENHEFIPSAKYYMTDNTIYQENAHPISESRKTPKKLTKIMSEELFDQIFNQEIPKSPAKYKPEENILYFPEIESNDDPIPTFGNESNENDNKNVEGEENQLEPNDENQGNPEVDKNNEEESNIQSTQIEEQSIPTDEQIFSESNVSNSQKRKHHHHTKPNILSNEIPSQSEELLPNEQEEIQSSHSRRRKHHSKSSNSSPGNENLHNEISETNSNYSEATFFESATSPRHHSHKSGSKFNMEHESQKEESILDENVPFESIDSSAISSDASKRRRKHHHKKEKNSLLLPDETETQSQNPTSEVTSENHHHHKRRHTHKDISNE